MCGEPVGVPRWRPRGSFCQFGTCFVNLGTFFCQFGTIFVNLGTFFCQFGTIFVNLGIFLRGLSTCEAFRGLKSGFSFEVSGFSSGVSGFSFGGAGL